MTPVMMHTTRRRIYLIKQYVTPLGPGQVNIGTPVISDSPRLDTIMRGAATCMKNTATICSTLMFRTPLLPDETQRVADWVGNAGPIASLTSRSGHS